MFFPNYNHIGLPELLIIVFIISLFFIINYYFRNIFPISSFKLDSIEENKILEPVSIIICARNEEDNLTEFLPKILTQNYPEFEVIVVNDCSYDNTENVIDEYAKIFSNLKKVTIKEDGYYKTGKKFAVMVGIKGTKYNNLLFIDADCYPASEFWLKDMAKGFVNKKEIVLGYGAYKKESGFLNTLIRFDTFLIALNYLSAAVKGNAYMGVGRNLGYTKELFYKEKGFANHYHIQSGDDDLFINQATTAENTNIVISHNSITYSLGKDTFSNWKRQKQRHLTTAPLYNFPTKRRIMLGFMSQYLFHILFFSLLFFKTTFIIALIGFFIKVIFQLVIFNKASKKLNEKDLWKFAFVYEFILLVIYPILHISKLLHKPNKWKS
jgi:cellulose synthase/poly-beta-1,6-N-acetylglucosamine synthase-like glycosyltransferase